MAISTTRSMDQKRDKSEVAASESMVTTTTSRDPDLVETLARDPSPRTPCALSTGGTPMTIALRGPGSTDQPWSHGAKNSRDLSYEEQLGDEIDAALFPTFDYGFGQYNDFSSSPLDCSSTTWRAHHDYSWIPDREETCEMRPTGSLDDDRLTQYPTEDIVSHLEAEDQSDACTKKANAPQMMHRGSSDLISETVAISVDCKDAMSSVRSPTRRLSSGSRARQLDVWTRDTVDFLVGLLSAIRRSTRQKRLSNESNSSPHCVYSLRMWEPYCNDRLLATHLTRLSDDLRSSEFIENCITRPDSTLQLPVGPGRRTECFGIEQEPCHGSLFRCTSIHIANGEVGTMDLGLSRRTKTDSMENRRHERSVIVPYRSEKDRRRDVLPKLWLQSIWQVLYCVWHSQQSGRFERQQTLKRKREHSPMRPCNPPLRDWSALTSKKTQDFEEENIVFGENSHATRHSDERGVETMQLDTVDLKTVLDEERARRLKAKAKEIALLNRFGLCLDQTCSEIDAENSLGMDNLTSQKDLTCQESAGQAKQSDCAITVDRKQRWKRACDDDDPRVKIRSLSRKVKRGRACLRSDPGRAATPATGMGSTQDSAQDVGGDDCVLEPSFAETADDQNEYDNFSECSLPRNQSHLENPTRMDRSPIVYDDVALSDRAKLLLQNLEARRHSKVEEPQTTSFPRNTSTGEPLHCALPTVTPKLSKQDRKRLKKEAKKKMKKRRRGKNENLIPRHYATKSDCGERSIRDEVDDASGPRVAREVDDSCGQRVSREVDDASGPRVLRTASSCGPSSISRESSPMAPDTDIVQTVGARLEQGRTNEDPQFPPHNKASSAKTTIASAPIEAGNSDTEESTLSVLCSEFFLERWGELIRILANGFRPTTKGDSPRRKFRFVDTEIIDDIGIDVEFQGRIAMIIDLLSEIRKTGFEPLLRRVVDLAAVSKYETVHVFISADVRLDDVATTGLLRLQNAAMNAKGLPSTVVFVHLVGQESLACSVADCLLIGGSDDHVDNIAAGTLEQHLSDPKVLERVLFLMSISPSMSLGNAFKLVQAFSAGGDLHGWFPLLLGHAASGQYFPQSIDVDADVLQQLSFALDAQLCTNR